MKKTFEEATPAGELGGDDKPVLATVRDIETARMRGSQRVDSLDGEHEWTDNLGFTYCWKCTKVFREGIGPCEGRRSVKLRREE